MLTNATNSFAGGATVSGQALDFNASHTIGLAFPYGGTLIPTVAGVLGTGNVTVNPGGRLLLDNVTYGNQNFIPNAATLTVAGGRLELIGNAAGTTELVGNLTLNAGNNFSTRSELVINSAAGGVTELQAPAFTRNGQSLTSFIGVGADLGSTTNSRIQITGGGTPFTNNTLFTSGTVQGPAGFDLVTDADGNGAAAPYYFGRVTSYANNINAGGNVAVRLDGTEPAANRVLTGANTIAGLILENGVTVSGATTLTLQTGGQGLIVSRGGANAISTTRLDFGGREPLFLVEAGGSLEVSSNLTGSNTLRKEGGGNLILSGDNDQVGLQYTGQIQINAGTLTARHSDAFGTTAGDVNIHDRAALVLDGNFTILNEVFRIRGTGLNNDYTGALQIVNGNTTWGTGATAVNYDTNPVFIAVEAGRTLTLNANIGGGGALYKRGGGELVYQGNDNGNTQAVTVNEGTLTLDKGGTNRAVRNTLTIDDLGNFDSFGAALVQYAGTAGTDNIENGVNVTVNHQGALNLNGLSDTINNLTISGASVTTGAGTLTMQNGSNYTTSGGSFTGNLILNGNITYTSGLATGGSAVMNGTLNLGGALRYATVNDGYWSNNDLTINSQLSNGWLNKAGGGALLLTNASNSFLADVSEVQTVTVPATVTSFNLQLNAFGANLTSPTIPYSTSTPAAAVQAALETMTNIMPGNVAVTGAAGGPYTVTFQGALAAIDLAQLTSAVVSGSGTITHATTTNGLAGFTHNGGIVALASNTALGTGRVSLTGNFATVVASGGPISLANPVTLYPNNNFVLGGRRDFTGNNSLTLAGPVNLGTPATNQDLNLQVDDPLTPVTISGAIAGGNSGSTNPTTGLRLQKTGHGHADSCRRQHVRESCQYRRGRAQAAEQRRARHPDG